MTIAYEQTYQLRTGDFDRYARLQPAAVLDVFQDAAGVNAESVPGMNWKELSEAGLFWAITRIKYEVLETPQIHEQITARTWPLAPNRMGFQREYTIKGLDGRPLVNATSEWVMIDRETRAFASARDFYQDRGIFDFSTETLFDKKIRKIRNFDWQEQEPALVVTPSFTDIDINGHVNNSRYTNFVMNALDLKEDEAIHTFQIDYRHEIHQGIKIALYTHREENTITVLGIDPEETCMFAAKIELTQ
ncbi:MAG: thioesterase [Eggerthellaceae bacterium]